MQNKLDNDVLVELLHRVAGGDARAFRKLYDATSPRLYAIALQMVRATAVADDVLQDAYVQVWHRAGDYHVERGSVGTWMASLVRYRAIDRLRQNRKDMPFDENSDHADGLADDATGPLGRAMRSDDNEFLTVCLERLSSAQRQSVALAFFKGLTHAELASTMAVPLGTIKSRLRRSLARLRECLDSAGFGDEISPGTG